MTIISCPSCGKSISDKSSSCVHCGAPLSREAEGLQSFDKAERKDGGQTGDSDSVGDVKQPTIDYMEAFLKDDAKTADMVGKYNKLNAIYKKIAWLWKVFICGIIALALVLSQGTDFLETFAGAYLVMLLIGVLLALLLGFRFIYNRSVVFIYQSRCSAWIKKNGYDVSRYINKMSCAMVANDDTEGIIGAGGLFDFSTAYLFSKDERAHATIKRHFIIRTIIAATLSAWLVIPEPLIAVNMAMSNFDVVNLLLTIIPVCVLFAAYIITYFMFTSKDNAKVGQQCQIVE